MCHIVQCGTRILLLKNILTSLNIQTANENEEGLTAIVPTNKVDVTRPCDLVEEILRIYGYNNVEISESVKSCLNQTHKPNPDKVQNLVSEII